MNAAQDLVVSYFERWCRLEEEKRVISDDLKALFAEAKGNGFDTKAMRAVFREQVGDKAEREEFDAICDLYRACLNAPRAQHAHTRGDENTKTVVSTPPQSNGQPGGMVPPPAVPPGAHSNPDARTDSKTPSQSRRENSRYESASERGRAHLELENGNTIRNHQTPPANLSSEVAI